MVQVVGRAKNAFSGLNRCLAGQVWKELDFAAMTYQRTLSSSASRLLRMVEYSGKNGIDKLIDIDQTISAAA